VAEETRSFKAEPEVRPPLTRRDHLAGDQCSGTIKAMKERGWDRRPAALRRGPTTKAEPPSGGFSFLRACLSCRSLRTLARSRSAGTGSPSRDPADNRSRPASRRSETLKTPSLDLLECRAPPRSSGRSPSSLSLLSDSHRSSDCRDAPTGTRVQDCESRVIRDSDGSEDSSCGGEGEKERERSS